MIVTKIYKQYEHKNDEPPRYHLGASQLGAECERATWYNYRWFKPESFNGRMLRLFETGQLAEARFAADLEAIGIKVLATDPETGKQFRVEAHEKHFSGSLDGIATGIDPEDIEKRYILEFKTHNDKSFTDLVKHGVECSKRQHYVQMQVYMGLTHVSQALYLAVNKNNDELYSEVVAFKPCVFAALLDKAKNLIISTQPPEKINNYPSFFKCKMCNFKDICHNNETPNKNCRTCIYSGPAKQGLWRCKKHEKNIDKDDQLKGCEDHEYIS